MSAKTALDQNQKSPSGYEKNGLYNIRSTKFSVTFIKMKSIKILILVIACFNFTCLKAQNLNNLSLDEFYNDISFNNISLSEIISAHGNTGSIQGLFSSATSTRDDNTAKSLDYEVDGYYFRFEEEELLSDKDTDYVIAYILVEGSSKVRIKNTEICVGDNVSKLGSVNILKPGKIVFYNEDTNASIDIFYDNSIITKISFVFD